MSDQRDWPKNLRTILLAYPKRTRRTKKYLPPPYIPGQVDSGVKPGVLQAEVEDNWRLNQLAKPNSRKITPIFVRQPENLLSGLSPATLSAEPTKRTLDLAIPPLWKLRIMRKDYSFLGDRFLKNINKCINLSWNCIYNYYNKAMFEVNAKLKRKALREPESKKEISKGKGKGKDKDAKTKGSGSPGKTKSAPELKGDRDKRFAEWAAKNARPKRTFSPPPPEPTQPADLEAMKPRMDQMSEPKFITKKYMRPSIDPTYIDPARVSPAAKTYVPTDHILRLAQVPEARLKKLSVIIPGAVKRGALTCIPSPRFAELAVPRKKLAQKDNDLKENPFEVSPNAKKYVASARIQELAKPTER